VTPVLPTGPVVGLRLVADGMTVKLVPEVAELVPSETTTLLAPTTRTGTVKVTAEDPLIPVVPPAVMVAVAPPTVTVRAWLAMKPDPEIVTDVPTAPLVGLGAPTD
jgi:hypothetical protein